MAERDSDPAPDPVGDFQRWLMRAGARSVGREVSGRVRRTLGGDSADRDVWDTATSEPESGEHLQCFPWCPICSAARLARDSGPGAPIAAVGDTLSSVMQGAFGAFEAVVKATEPPETTEPTGAKPPATKALETKAPEKVTEPESAEPSPGASAELSPGASAKGSTAGSAKGSTAGSAKGSTKASAKGSTADSAGDTETAASKEEARGAAHEPDDRG